MNELRVVLATLNDDQTFNDGEVLSLVVDLLGEQPRDEVGLKDVVRFLEYQQRAGHRRRASKARQMIDTLTDADLGAYRDHLEDGAARGVEFVTFVDDDYPERLWWIDSPPLGLYVRGDVSSLRNGVAVVGTREATGARLDYTETIAQKLVEMGRTVVSGLANGVDTAAHEGALAAGGDTVAVLPGDVGTIRPSGNRALGERIADDGALVAEVSPEVGVHRGRFVQRNRITSGISEAVVVGASGETGGTVRQAEFAQAQGVARFLYDPPEEDGQSPATVVEKGFLTFETADELEALLESDLDDLPASGSRGRTLLDYT